MHGYLTNCRLSKEVEEVSSVLNDEERRMLRHFVQIFPDADPFHIIEIIDQAENKDMQAIADRMLIFCCFLKERCYAILLFSLYEKTIMPISSFEPFILS